MSHDARRRAKPKRKGSLLLEAVLQDAKRELAHEDERDDGPSLLDVLRDEYEEYASKPFDSKLLIKDRDVADAYEFALWLLTKYHPKRGADRQKTWTDWDKYKLVLNVEMLIAVGYGARESCALLEAAGHDITWRRYLDFKKTGAWKFTGIDAALHVTHSLGLPLPKKPRPN